MQLAEAEQAVLVPAGGALIRSLATFHRVAPLAGRGARIVQTLTFRAAAHRFAGLEGWPARGYEEGLQHFLISSRPHERALIGFPLPGDPFWTGQTLRGVAERYPGMDMRPYRDAFERASRSR